MLGRLMLGLVRVLMVLALLGSMRNGRTGEGADAQRAMLQVDGLRTAARIEIDGNTDVMSVWK